MSDRLSGGERRPLLLYNRLGRANPCDQLQWYESGMYTLHLITTDDVAAFLAGNPQAMSVASDRDARRALLDLAALLAARHPSWYFDDISLTQWEASIERGIGMMLRPASRILIDAGMDRAAAQVYPIRLDSTGGPAGGAYMPASLVPQARQLLEMRLDRQITRMRDAEMDPVANLGAMLLALEAAERANAGLFEAAGVPHGALAAGQSVHTAERKSLPKDLRTRLEDAAKPPKKPGLIARIRGGSSKSQPQVDSAQFWDGDVE